MKLLRLTPFYWIGRFFDLWALAEAERIHELHFGPDWREKIERSSDEQLRREQFVKDEWEALAK